MGDAAIDWDAVWRGETANVVPYVAEGLEVLCMEGRGRGVRASVRFAAGDLLLAERAVTTAAEPELAKVLTDGQADLDFRRQRCLALMCDGGDLDGPQQPIPLREWPGQLLLQDTASSLRVPLERMRRIVDLNAYRCNAPVSEYAFIVDGEVTTTEAERHQTYGLYILGALVNHSCTPNLSKVLLADWVFLRAARELSPGEELTQFYCDVRMPPDMRTRELQRDFGFTCTCERCTFEKFLKKRSGNSLDAWSGLYSCQVPGFHTRGPVQVSHLEGVVAEAERSALTAFAALSGGAAEQLTGSTEGSAKGGLPSGAEAAEEKKQWLLWPLVPALSQLAERLGLDGRLDESLVLWRRAERAARAVLPFSNVHLRVLSEQLLLIANLNVEIHQLKDAVVDSLRAHTVAYGRGLSVWRLLVGFRMPPSVLELVEELAASMAPQAGQPVAGAPIKFEWVSSPEESTTSRRRATFTVHSDFFIQIEDIRLDVSPDTIIVGAPSVEDFRITCPFKVDVERVQPKFSRRQHTLTVTILEQAD